MTRLAASILLAGVCACHKREEATTTPPPPPVVASPDTVGSAEIQHMIGLLDEAAAPDPVDAGTPGPSYGHGSTRLGGNTMHAPSIRQSPITVVGRLPTEVVQRVVRRNFGRLRSCYENGLRSDPNLAGKVVTKFIVDPKGNVTTAANDATGTTLKDASVVTCVTTAFSSLTFPPPEGGIVMVTYPITFAPSD